MAHNISMLRFVACLYFFLFSTSVFAWNASGHRLIAYIAWEQLSITTQEFITNALIQHPDYLIWKEKAGADNPADIFAEASVWPDTIRNDPRFYDERYESPTSLLPGFTDMARHKQWHFMNIDKKGVVKNGELENQIRRLESLLRTSNKTEEFSYSLPWFLHLVGEIHQPLHIGYAEDKGGSNFEINNPYSKRRPISSLHEYWDNLAAPSGMKGKRAKKHAMQMLRGSLPPKQGDVSLWRQESYSLLKSAYPKSRTKGMANISLAFHNQANVIANRRIVDAGYRLGSLLNSIVESRLTKQ